MSSLTFQGPTFVLQSAREGGYPTSQTAMSPPAGYEHEVREGSGSDSGPESDSRRQQPQTQEQRPKQQPTKRTRVLLSCALCRVSKLKCDRQQPCSQCFKKGRVDGCVYAPKPQKPVPAPRSMTARLKRLEAMVRGMMDNGSTDADGLNPVRELRQREEREDPSTKEETHAQVVLGRTTRYVGATHFMAMLDDIEDLKSYFDEDGDEGDNLLPDQSPEPTDTDLLLISSGGPMSKRDIIEMLPPRHVVDRLVQRWFNASSPTQPLVHRPTFVKQYNDFWQDPYHAPMAWLALLLMILALGTFYSIYAAPHEVSGIHLPPPLDVYRAYRGAAGWALVAARYTNPSMTKMQAYLLYAAAEFMTNRASSANCYVLSSVAIRLMLQMGFHRDPDKLPNIAPFDGEMRRRMWHVVVQMELLVSFHMGLPSMLNGLECDVSQQANITDDDIYPGMTALPPPRPDSEATQMTYARWKSALCEIFGKIATQNNSITVPPYSEVMRLDGLLESKWKQVPSFMHIRPLQDSITDPAQTIHQRFGLASLYQKSRCVLHRRYLTEAIPKKEHAYSRRVCLEAAITMLEYQDAIHLATLPGGVLRQHGWFLAAIATYDFLIAAMIIYVVYQSDTYDEDEAYSAITVRDDSSRFPPSRDELLARLRRSHQTWVIVAEDNPMVKKAADILGTMLKRIDQAKNTGIHLARGVEQTAQQGVEWQQHIAPIQCESADPMSTLSISDEAWQSSFVFENPISVLQPREEFPIPGTMVSEGSNLDGTPWLDLGTGPNDVWNTFDIALGGNDARNYGMTQADWSQQAADPQFIFSDQFGS